MRILFAGTPAFAAFHLNALLDAGINVVGVITQPDKPGKRGKTLIPSEVKTLAEDRGLPVTQPEKLAAADIEAFEPDLLVVVAYGQILRDDVLSLPRHGCLNVHASLLPRWRGAAPIQRSILAGDDRTGVCTMKMDAGLDTGDVYQEVLVPIDATDTADTLTAKLQEAGAGALIDTITAIGNGSAVAIPQPAEGVTYAHKIEKEEARINWSLDADQIDRHIRAFNPDPIAFTVLGDLRIKIWEAHPGSGTGEPGVILSSSKKGIEVGCGRSSIVVTRLQLPVGKGTVMGAADVLNSRREAFSPGNRFE